MNNRKPVIRVQQGMQDMNPFPEPEPPPTPEPGGLPGFRMTFIDGEDRLEIGSGDSFEITGLDTDLTSERAYYSWTFWGYGVAEVWGAVELKSGIFSRFHQFSFAVGSYVSEVTFSGSRVMPVPATLKVYNFGSDFISLQYVITAVEIGTAYSTTY